MSRAFEYDVFLSYSSKDKKIVHDLAERLKRNGLRVLNALGCLKGVRTSDVIEI